MHWSLRGVSHLGEAKHRIGSQFLGDVTDQNQTAIIDLLSNYDNCICMILLLPVLTFVFQNKFLSGNAVIQRNLCVNI